MSPHSTSDSAQHLTYYLALPSSPTVKIFVLIIYNVCADFLIPICSYSRNANVCSYEEKAS